MSSDVRVAYKLANKQGRIAAAQRRKRKGTEASLERALDLLRRVLADGLTPALEREMHGAINHQEALSRKREMGAGRGE